MGPKPSHRPPIGLLRSKVLGRQFISKINGGAGRVREDFLLSRNLEHGKDVQDSF